MARDLRYLSAAHSTTYPLGGVKILLPGLKSYPHGLQITRRACGTGVAVGGTGIAVGSGGGVGCSVAVGLGVAVGFGTAVHTPGGEGGGLKHSGAAWVVGAVGGRAPANAQAGL